MWQTNIENHYRIVWNIKPEPCKFSEGPIGQLPHDFSILRFPPHGDRKMWTYATRCMSLPEDKKPIELHMFSPWQTKEVVELLVVTAHFHRTSKKLDIGHTVNFGRPWIDDSNCQNGLVSLPYLDGPKLEILSLGSRKISFYWLIPVTNSEIEFKKNYGLEALEAEFDRTAFDYVDPKRRSVV
jgi:Suppressor of fused protein (SUFU)